MRISVIILGVVMFLMTVSSATAYLDPSFNESCYSASAATDDGNGTLTDFVVQNNCIAGSSIEWDNVNLVFGNISTDELAIGKDSMFVDAGLRPDLNSPATLTFIGHSFAVRPILLRDGSPCNTCNLTYKEGRIVVGVPGFSNYTLTQRQDFIVYSDQEPELDDKVYQTIDVGDVFQGNEFACIVQIFGRNDDSEWILVQTNPERKAVGNVFGDPDTNQPESLGYFETKNGIANTYFRSHRLHGYSDFELVIQCTSSNERYIYEESISTRYVDPSRPIISRGVWLTDGNNAFYLTVWVVFGLFTLWIGGMIWRSVKP